jgi:hypothetical protein
MFIQQVDREPMGQQEQDESFPRGCPFRRKEKKVLKNSIVFPPKTAPTAEEGY